MNMPCTNCGETLPLDAYRCPACDALAPLPDDATRIEDARTEGSGSEETGSQETQAMPWAIPIREGGSVRSRNGDRLRPVVYGVAAVALLAGVVALGSQVLGGGDTEAASDSGPEVAGQTADVDVDDTVSTSTSTSSSTSTTVADETSTTSTTSTSSTVPPSTAAPTTTTSTPAGAPAPGSAPQLSSSFGGGWVAQLTSVPTSAGPGAAESAWRDARAYASGAVVATSDDWSSLKPGFWVVVDDGPFASADEVRAFCASVEHTAGSDCMPRELTGRR